MIYNIKGFYKYSARPRLSLIKEIETAAAKRGDVVSLAQGIPDFTMSAEIVNYICEYLHNGSCSKYSLTRGLDELRTEIALSLAKEGIECDPETELIVTAGASEAIMSSLLTIVEPGDEVIILSPSYTLYGNAVAIAGGIPVYAKLDEENNFNIIIEEVEKKLSNRTKAILFCNPNNPSGTVFTYEDVLNLVNLACNHEVYLISDEVYKDYYYTNDPHISPICFTFAKEWIIRVFSFSKAYAMTGLRVGYLQANASLCHEILARHDSIVTCAPVISQYAAIAALKFGDKLKKEIIAQCKKRRAIVLQALDELTHFLDYQLPKASYFAFPRIKEGVRYARDSYRLAMDILDKVGLAVVPGIAFGPSGEGHVRICWGRAESDVKAGIQRLVEYFLNKKTNTTAFRTFSPLLSNRQVKTQHSFAYRSSVKRIGAFVLKACAKSYLNRTKPIIIGIVGIRGKTLCKRKISSVLARKWITRHGMLSYNTSLGLPLAVLGLKSPDSIVEAIKTFAKAIFRGLFGKKQENVLVLEYGIEREDPTSYVTLSEIAKPDWIVVTPFESAQFRCGECCDDQSIQWIRNFISQVPKERIFWCANDLVTKEQLSDLLEQDRAVNIEVNPHNASMNMKPFSEEFAIAIADKLSECLAKYSASSHNTNLLQSRWIN